MYHPKTKSRPSYLHGVNTKRFIFTPCQHERQRELLTFETPLQTVGIRNFINERTQNSVLIELSRLRRLRSCLPIPRSSGSQRSFFGRLRFYPEIRSTENGPWTRFETFKESSIECAAASTSMKGKKGKGRFCAAHVLERS